MAFQSAGFDDPAIVDALPKMLSWAPAVMMTWPPSA